MFNLDDEQIRVLRLTAASAGGFWVCNQIADSTVMQRVWHQATILSLCVGALRVWVHEAMKRSHR